MKHAAKLLCTLSATALISPLAMAQSFEATLAHPHQNYGVEAAEAFKNYIEAATDGELVINLVRHGALGGDREITDQLRLGELEFNLPGAGGIASIFPHAQVHSWPFLFTERSVFWELPQDPEYFQLTRDELLEASGGTMRLLALMENSIRHLYTTAGPIRVPSDLEEHAIKMRTQAVPLHQELFEALGAAQIVTVSAPERYSALQSGLIDGLEGGLSSAWDAGLMEVADYVSLTGHMYEYLWLVSNNDFYESLPEEFQQAVDEAAIIASATSNVVSFKDDNEALEKMAEAGKEIYVPTADELSEWQDIAVPAARDFIEEEVPESYIQATLDALERTRERVAGIKNSESE
ncbi:TRAP transporter substrate-binding protein [Franzmannia qiaohouensis]|uniref:TRAP transporter substrate-binding protein n=1 Tax=Franzmannia qiaohouensis TaxID=1329370 RepID=A0ABU1HIV1_9GAMM|nr:TRAP transporter substrate-binding protein [Halomonas qiaohouensis]MDR5906495.1 TRAP transporter substrate-binding protein [Halomonas qiaohouensis]